MKWATAVIVSAIAVCACRAQGERRDADGRIVLKLWRHETADAELTASLQAIERFNEEQSRWRIDVDTLPQGSYTEAITAAALAGQLPCILDVDQPGVPNFAWTGHLRPLEGLVSDRKLASINSGAKGTYRGKTYSVGQFDAALALFARRSVLQANDVRIATLEAPYTADELLSILGRLKARDPSRFPFDINTKLTGEWIAYAFSPWLQSAGADLIDRRSYLVAEGVLNSPEAVRVIRWYKRLFDDELVERQSVDVMGFLQGRSDIHYSGSWVAKEYAEQVGDDLVIMPPIDFGGGPRIGSGSWQWGISRTCAHPDGAAAFVEFLLRPAEIAAICRATGLVPVSDASAALTPRYRPGEKWRLFYEFAKRYAVARPATPAYPKISSAFEKALLDVRNGRPVVDALDTAVDSIEYDIERNRGYGFADAQEAK